MPQPPRPLVYELYTRVWLHELSRRAGRRVTLRDVPDDELDRLAALGTDWLWLLGVWQTGPAGRTVSRTNPDWQHEFRAALPDLTEDDVCGSCFAITRYAAHEDFGGNEALAHLRGRLRDRGVNLLLDFVPNHFALDHPWVSSHPEFFVHGTAADLSREPHNYCTVVSSRGPLILAHGRDPYFPGWPDTLQLNYRHAGLRSAMTAELLQIAGRCDGVRCDVAMLLLPEVIARTWGDRSRPADGSAPVNDPFWPGATALVRDRHAEFFFLAEVYWDLEWVLQRQGFDATYDKRLYDRLRDGDADAVRGHLHADAEFQNRSVRFLENHDEPRAAVAFPGDGQFAAAAVALLLPGYRFLHDGQLEGRTVRVPVHLGRRPDEPVNGAVRDFYRRLLPILRRPEVRTGQWRLLDCRPAWEGNPTDRQFLAFSWQAGEARLLVAVNYGPVRGQCFVTGPFADPGERAWRFRDLLGTESFVRDGGDLAARGLYLDLPARACQAFEVTAP